MPRWRLEKEFRFEASHQLMQHDGKCARLHGHSWVGRIRVSGDGLKPDGPKQGMLVDFSSISALLKPIVERLDHFHLNDIIDPVAPTSEVVAQWIANEIVDMFPPDGRLRLDWVRIEETCTSACEYEP